MKRSVKQTMILALTVLGAFAYYSCEKNDVPLEVKLSTLPPEAQPEGSILTFLDGNVTLDVLPGAVSEPVLLSVSECHNGSNCNLAVKSISIEPSMSFNVPITVSIKYDGDLANSQVPVEGCPLVTFSWDKKASFYDGVTGKMCCCFVDQTSKTITFHISQTGVFAVGMRPAGL
jgi:hypothetical protein